MRTICLAALRRVNGVGGHTRPALDIGCGTGLWTQTLAQFGPVVGLDLVQAALAFCRRRGVQRLVQATAEALPFRSGSFDLVTALAVIEHLDDDHRFVRELRDVTAPSHYVLLLTSAYRWLWGRHDEVVHHRRRYHRHELEQLLHEAGLEPVRLSYVNMFLFPVIALLRLVEHVTGRPTVRAVEGSPDLFMPGWLLNQVLYSLLALEAWLLRYIDLPFGVGLMALARRPEENPVRLPSARDVLSAYHEVSWSAQLRVLGRYVLCPYAEVLRRLPHERRILDVGCGDGLLLWLAARMRGGHLDGLGIDHDEDKIAVARTLGIDGVEFAAQDLSEVPTASVDCVTIVDVLYCVPQEQWRDLLRHCIRVLRPGGTLVVKEVTNTPRWKHWLIVFEESLAIRVLRMTRGSTPHFASIDAYRQALEAAGAEVTEARRVDRGRHAAHVLFVARRPGVAEVVQ